MSLEPISRPSFSSTNSRMKLHIDSNTTEIITSLSNIIYQETSNIRAIEICTRELKDKADICLLPFRSSKRVDKYTDTLSHYTLPYTDVQMSISVYNSLHQT